MNKIALSLISASVVGAGIAIYLHKLKSKIKKFVLRNENIEKYFREEK